MVISVVLDPGGTFDISAEIPVLLNVVNGAA
jgi:hypothetical protein